MKRKLISSGFFTLLIAFVACTKSDVEIPQNLVSSPVSITNLRKVQLKDNLEFGTTAIKGVVISDVAAGNFEENLIAVQEAGKDAAILVQLNEKTTHAVGTEVEIDLKGSKLEMKDEELTITSISSSAIKATGNTITVVPKSTNLSSIEDEATYWGPILVRLEKLTLSGGQNGKMSGELSITDGIATGYSNFLAASAFSNEDYPPQAETFIGIVRQKSDKIFVNPRNMDDVQAVANEVVEDFEDASNTNYDSKVMAFKTGSYTLDGGITATSSSDLKTGKQSIRLQGTITNANRKGILAMNFNLQGVKKLRISHGIYPAAAELANVNPTTFDVEISRNNGASYTLLKQIEVDTKTNALKTDVIEVNAGKTEDVRFRIVNSSAPFTNNSRPRINLDDLIFEY